MQREVLNLPEPAKTLLDATFHELDRTLADVVPDGERWRLGGGMKSLGLERRMLRAHRSQADYVADTQQKLDRS